MSSPPCGGRAAHSWWVHSHYPLRRTQCASTRAIAGGQSGYGVEMPDIHIVPHGDQWNVKVENGDVVGTYDTQATAEAEGKTWARERGGGEVFVHRDEGEFSRIRKGDAV